MSSWADLHERLYRLDHTIINKLEVLVNNQLSNDEYLDSNTFKLLEDPLIFSNFENYDFTDVPRENLLEVIDILKKEKIELTRVFNEVERERKTLRQQNFKLMERLFTQENFETIKIDRDFNRFLSKSLFLHYELYKKFLEQERDRNEQLQILLNNKDIELKQMNNKIIQLEEKLLQTRDMWKKSILETSTSSNIPTASNKSYTSKFPIPPKSPVGNSSSHMTLNETIFKQNVVSETKKFGLYQTKGSIPLSVENDVEASINDKIQNKIKELMNGKASPANRNHDAIGNISNRSLILDKSLLGLTIHEDNFSEVEEDAFRQVPFIANLKSDNDLDKFKELRSETNLDKSHVLTGKLNKTSIAVNGSKGSPKKMATPISGGKSPIDDTKKTLGRSSSQKSVGLASSKGISSNSKPSKRISDKLNSTTNFDLNISNDNLNTTILSTTDNDSRKTYSDSKKKPVTSKLYTTSNFNTTNKTKTFSATAKSTSNISSLSSPKNLSAKPKLNINSSPVTVKKK